MQGDRNIRSGLGAMALLGFASGLPSPLTGQTMQLWLCNAGIDVAAIGLFSLVTLPYALKFLWAPLMDRYTPGLDRRRGWLLVTQPLVAAAIVLMARCGPQGTSASLHLFATGALILALFSASQDIVADAYRTDLFPGAQAGAGASVFVSGYRLALIASGSGALVLSAYTPWSTVYLLMAALMLLGLVGIALGPVPPPDSPPETLRQAVVEPARDFLKRNGRAAGWIVLFVLLFRLPDVLGGSMTTPLLSHLKFSNQSIGLWKQAFGLGISIPGAILGGVLVSRWGMRRCLWVFGILQALSNGGFWLLALAGHHQGLMVGVIGIENLCGGLAVAGYMAFLMNQCNPRYSASQYALLTSLMAAASSLMASPMGFLAKAWGFPAFFALTVLAAAPGLALIALVTRPRPLYNPSQLIPETAC